jgi:hypothetical protein
MSTEPVRTWLKHADLDEGKRHDGVPTQEQEELRRLIRTCRDPHPVRSMGAWREIRFCFLGRRSCSFRFTTPCDVESGRAVRERRSSSAFAVDCQSCASGAVSGRWCQEAHRPSALRRPLTELLLRRGVAGQTPTGPLRYRG